MTRVNNGGYIEKRCGRNSRGKREWRDWWLVKCCNTNCGKIGFKTLIIPQKYVGKRVRFKIEVIEDQCEN